VSVYEPHFWGDLWYEVFPEDRPESEPGGLGHVEQPPHGEAEHDGLDQQADE
jgi:hypothetical protein